MEKELTEKELEIRKKQRECSINNSMANLEKDVLSLETALKASAETLEDMPDIITICKKHIPNIETLRKDIASYLAK